MESGSDSDKHCDQEGQDQFNLLEFLEMDEQDNSENLYSISEKEQLARKIEIIKLEAHQKSKVTKFEEHKQNLSAEQISEKPKGQINQIRI